MNNLEHDFYEAMMEIYRLAKKECRYNSTRFLEMLHDHGGIGTARRLLRGNKPQSGLTKMWDCGRLDITVECLALNPRFQELFEEHELETARRRLRRYAYDPERCEKTRRRTANE